jgi:cold shock CspA family protein
LSEIKSTGNNELKIKGWVFAEKKIDTVSIFADSKFLGKLPVHLHRQDVYDKFKTCLHLDCGFSGQIPFDSPPVFNLKLEFYAQSHALAIIEKSVNLNPDNSTLSGPGTGQRESWLSLKTDDSPGMKRRVELANRGMGLTENDRRIGALYNKHKGEIAFLIGNGPSVRVEDLEKLHNAVTFGCNRLYLAYDRMTFRPTYLCSTDHQMIKDFGAEMVEKHPGTVLFVAPERPRIAGDFVWFPMKSRTPIEFSENVYDFVMPGGGTLIAAMQMGYHMGITRFVLYGVDHHFHYEKNKNASGVLESARGDGNHFIPDYRSGKPWTPPLVFQVEGAFLSCHVFLQSKNGWVKNATRGGQLEILERIDFDEIVPGGWHPQPIHGQPDAVLSGASSQKFAEKTKLHKVSIKEGWHPQPIHGQPDAVLSRAASQKFAEKTNLHKVKRSPGKTTTSRGKIKWFTARKQFGFIQSHQGEEILFVHKKFIMNPDPEDLQVGTPVCYEPYQGPKGLEARNLRLLPEKIRR